LIPWSRIVQAFRFAVGCIAAATIVGGTEVAPINRASGQPAPDHNKKAEWAGTLEWSSQQPVPAGTQHFSGRLELTFDEDDAGGLKGTLAGTQSQKLDLSNCPSVAVSPGTLKARVSGTVTPQRMVIAVAEPAYTPPRMSPCPTGGPPATAPGIFRWPHFEEVFRDLSPVDEDHYQFEREWTVPQRYPYTIRYTLKVERVSEIVPRAIE